ncbi:MAG TPA: PLP-dependent aminotransferase family protein [Mycobacteriales bacterium]|jgi:DNA-binding transcriptional MocR family regulator|nr:PLP-dependent aminotransferase family protein [Mycobacteriales bacterium]
MSSIPGRGPTAIAAGPQLAGVNQGHVRSDLVDLAPGHPDPDLLPVGLIGRWTELALRTWGARTLSYGADAGPLPLRAALAERVEGPAGAAACPPQSVVVTGGTSAAIGELAALLGRQGRAVLTETPTYELGRLIFAGRGLRTVRVPGPLDDLDVGELRRAAVRLARETGVPPAVYLIPTFHNPTGRVLSEPRRQEVAELAAELGLLVIEDQAYAEIHAGTPPPPSIGHLAADPDSVVSLHSMAKCLGPGVRIGWLVTGERLAAELAGDPVRVSGGGFNHLSALVVAAGCLSGELDEHVEGLREQLRRRREALLEPLLAGLPAGFSVAPPAGGYFAWVRLPAGTDEEELARAAERHGMAFAPGHRFGSTTSGARLCFAARGPAEVSDGAARFVAACGGLPG